MKGRFRNITILSVYSPTEERDEIEKRRFYDKVDKTCSSTSRYDMVLVVRDYSTKVEKDEDQRQAAGPY